VKVKSAKHKNNFKLNSTNGHSVDILSVSSEGQLLAGQSNDRQLHIYGADCSHLTSITLPDNDKSWDAVWTPLGNIVYSDYHRRKVVTLSLSGVVIKQANISKPSYFSVFNDDAIHLISADTSVFQSADGLTWSHVFDVSDDWKCKQVIKVRADSKIDVLWTVIWSGGDRHLRVFTVYKQQTAGDNVSWSDVSTRLRDCQLTAW
jgi:hypothetical protein